VLAAFVLGALVLFAGDAWGQLSDAPAPIAAPPIPPAAGLAPAPRLGDTGGHAPAKPDPGIPAVPAPAPVKQPGIAEITQADPGDTTGIPPLGPAAAAAKGDPARTGAAAGPGFEETAFAVEPGSGDYPKSAQVKLLEVAEALKADPSARVEIRAYAPDTPQGSAKGRRLALTRFLAVRDFLTANGIADARIDARALGTAPEETGADRIELYVEH
jgi:hypothetical protein